MRLNHIHFRVRDLSAAIGWLEQVWDVQPTFRNERMAVIPFDSITLILDSADQESIATVGFASENCDKDYHRVIAKGAVSEEAPSDRPWGARTAYVRGPGGLRFEIEQLIS
ncbi:MAG: VOC family protein [Acidobacteria bacterium]|nr:VOC family protein [Acidobacteriota bacterium]